MTNIEKLASEYAELNHCDVDLSLIKFVIEHLSKQTEFREFYVAETLKGELHIFRENHSGGGLTKFVEYTAIAAKNAKIAELENFRSQDQSSIEKRDHEIAQLKLKIQQLESELEIKTAALNISTSKVLYDSVCKELTAKTEAVEELVNALDKCCVEIFCLMKQRKPSKDLTKMGKNSGSVANAYHTAQELLTKHAKGQA